MQVYSRGTQPAMLAKLFIGQSIPPRRSPGRKKS
jgi:hypothetical protein